MFKLINTSQHPDIKLIKPENLKIVEGIFMKVLIIKILK